MSRHSDEPDVLSIPAAGLRLGVGRSLAYELARQGVIPTLALGAKRVVPIVQLECLLSSKHHDPNYGGPASCD